MIIRKCVPLFSLSLALSAAVGHSAAQGAPAQEMTQLDRQTRAAAQGLMQRAAREARVSLQGGLLYGSRGDVLVVSTPVQGAERVRPGSGGDLLFVYVAGADPAVLPAGFYRVRLVPGPGAGGEGRSTAQFINAQDRTVAEFPAVARGPANGGGPAGLSKPWLTVELSPDGLTIDIEIELSLSMAVHGIPIGRATPASASDVGRATTMPRP